MSKLEEAISIFGTQLAFAREVGVTSQAVSQWRRRPEGRQVPAERVGSIVEAVRRHGGDIRHGDLRPDLYQGVSFNHNDAA